MVSKTVSFRLPDEVVRAIEANANATGQTRTAIVVDALAKALGVQRASSEITLQQRVSALEQRVAALEQEKVRRLPSASKAIARQMKIKQLH